MGLNFRSGPPRFKNDRKHNDQEQVREVTDSTKHEKKDLREIINQEKRKEEEGAGKHNSYKVR